MITYPEFADTDLSQLALARFQAAVFDLDGVLTRTAVLHAAAWKRALDEVMQALGASLQPFDLEDDYRLYIDGRPRLDGVAAFVRARGAELPTGSAEDPPGAATQWGVSRLKNSYFHDELSRRGVDVFEDAVALADGLRAEGKQLAVVTASENGHLVLQRAGIADRFDAVLTGVEAQALAACPESRHRTCSCALRTRCQRRPGAPSCSRTRWRAYRPGAPAGSASWWAWTATATARG